MMELHPKKRIEITIEEFQAPELIELIEQAGAKGYTMLRNVSGKGDRGIRGLNSLMGVFGSVIITVVADEVVAEKVIKKAYGLMEDIAGIIVVSDVQVIRTDHF